MAEKKKDEEVLLVRDEKTGEISVVAGLNRDGTPKRTPANAKHAQDFLRFDRNGDALTTFLTNFYRQCKEPNRFGFYRVAVDGMEKVMEVVKNFLKEPETYKDLLAPHKVDTSAIEQQVAQERAAQEQPAPQGETEQTGIAENETQEQEQGETQEENEAQEQAQSESPVEEQTAQEVTEGQQAGVTEQGQTEAPAPQLDENGFNWTALEQQWGISLQELTDSKELSNLNKNGLSNLVTIRPEIGGQRYEIQARLEVRTMPDGSKNFEPHFIQKEPKLELPYKGVEFTDADRKSLQENGNLGRVAEIVDRETGEITPSFISIDRQTNELTDIPASEIKIPQKIGKTELAKAEQDLLAAGLPLKKEIELNNNRKFTTTLQVNVQYKGVEFVPKNKPLGQAKLQRQGKREQQGAGQQKAAANGDGNTAQTQGGNKPSQARSENKPEQEQRRSTWLTKEGTIRPIESWKKQKLSEQQKKDYVEGKTIVLLNSTDWEGNPCTKYIKFDWEKGKPTSRDEYPNQSQATEVIPSNESRTQMAVNNDGATNEATKHVSQPLQQGQVAPANARQQEQQRQREQQGVPQDEPKKGRGMRM